MALLYKHPIMEPNNLPVNAFAHKNDEPVNPTAGGDVFAMYDHIVGPISELDITGMSFIYYEHDLNAEEKRETINIFARSAQILLTGLKTKTTKDAPLPCQNLFFPGARRKRTIEFIQLTSSQKQQISDLLKAVN